MQDLKLVHVFILSMLGFELALPLLSLFTFFHLFKHCGVASCGERVSRKEKLGPTVTPSHL